MATVFGQANLTAWASHFPFVAEYPVRRYAESYEEHRYRVYALAFWMTDNELEAERITVNVFERAFASDPQPAGETLDRILLSEIRELMPIGLLQLQTAEVRPVAAIRGNVKKVHLERAVVQLPPTERLIFLMHDVESYDHSRIARTLSITELESQSGLHEARLRLRELLADMM